MVVPPFCLLFTQFHVWMEKWAVIISPRAISDLWPHILFWDGLPTKLSFILSTGRGWQPVVAWGEPLGTIFAPQFMFSTSGGWEFSSEKRNNNNRRKNPKSKSTTTGTKVGLQKYYCIWHFWPSDNIAGILQLDGQKNGYKWQEKCFLREPSWIPNLDKNAEFGLKSQSSKWRTFVFGQSVGIRLLE